MAIRDDEDTEPEQTSDSRMPRTARGLFDALPHLPGLRQEVIKGSLIVSPMGTPEHAWIASDLSEALLPIRRERGWRAAVGTVSVCIEGSRESLSPDYLLSPPNCRRWGDYELLSSHVLLVAEVVSPTSAHRDHHEKQEIYAQGGVPVYLLIDPIASQPAAIVFSEIKDGAYQKTTRVVMGTPLYLPKPIDFELDTSIFKA
ncbi:Uma2 family endonuclease [Nonomuraea guangzhouensis]|uniref:Uma2 family endonuclease n=1 Tax=Nonomuraea guangzhouensis TaxID=1291555 RepID=A0ABW4G6B5_9ACTN|nr:Uma2 family endonuclease [Nonomuraea guangzhouensis]